MGLYDLGFGVEMELPDLFKEHGPRNDAPGISHQIFE